MNPFPLRAPPNPTPPRRPRPRSRVPRVPPSRSAPFWPPHRRIDQPTLGTIQKTVDLTIQTIKNDGFHGELMMI